MIGDPDENEHGLARYHYSDVSFWWVRFLLKTNWRDVTVPCTCPAGAWLSACLDRVLRIIWGCSWRLLYKLQRGGNRQPGRKLRLGDKGREKDPSRHPETNRLVQKALKRRRKQKHLNKEQPLPLNCRLSFLPLDVWLLFNYLGYYDLWNLMKAVQFPFRINTGVDGLMSIWIPWMMLMNWSSIGRFLCLEHERLHATLGVWRNIGQSRT